LVLFKAIHGSFCLTDVLNTVHGVISFDRELNFNEIYPTLSNPKSIKNLKIYALISFDYLKNHINFNTIENGKLQHRNWKTFVNFPNSCILQRHKKKILFIIPRTSLNIYSSCYQHNYGFHSHFGLNICLKRKMCSKISTFWYMKRNQPHLFSYQTLRSLQLKFIFIHL